MRDQRFVFYYILVTVLQVILCNYLNLSQYIFLAILPVMVLLIPLRRSTIFAMVVAFATGLFVDSVSDGVLGLNALALVPVALMRKPVITAVFGTEVFARKEDVSYKKYGWIKFLSSIVLVQALYLIIYIAADGAGTRPFWFNATRFAASLGAGCLVSLFIAAITAKDTRDK